MGGGITSTVYCSQTAIRNAKNVYDCPGAAFLHQPEPGVQSKQLRQGKRLRDLEGRDPVRPLLSHLFKDDLSGARGQSRQSSNATNHLKNLHELRLGSLPSAQRLCLGLPKSAVCSSKSFKTRLSTNLYLLHDLVLIVWSEKVSSIRVSRARGASGLQYCRVLLGVRSLSLGSHTLRRKP